MSIFDKNISEIDIKRLLIGPGSDFYNNFLLKQPACIRTGINNWENVSYDGKILNFHPCHTTAMLCINPVLDPTKYIPIEILQENVGVYICSFDDWDNKIPEIYCTSTCSIDECRIFRNTKISSKQVQFNNINDINNSHIECESIQLNNCQQLTNVTIDCNEIKFINCPFLVENLYNEIAKYNARIIPERIKICNGDQIDIIGVLGLNLKTPPQYIVFHYNGISVSCMRIKDTNRYDIYL